MAQVAPTVSTVVRPSSAFTSSRPRQPGIVLLWSLVAALLLGGSGIIRSMQTRYYGEETDLQIRAPFPLADIPKSVDGWNAVSGSMSLLDPLTARITGSTDHTLVNFSNEETGTILQVMLLYGPAEPVLPHIPEVCYPATGFRAVGPSIDREIKVKDQPVGMFRSVVFGKAGGRAPVQETAYYSFWHDGAWVPTINMRNTPRKNPGIFKLQIQRLMAPTENRFEDEPIENFLKKFLPPLDAMIHNTTSRPDQGNSKSP